MKMHKKLHTEHKRKRSLPTQLIILFILLSTTFISVLSILLLVVGSCTHTRLFALSILMISILIEKETISYKQRQSPRLSTILITFAIAGTLWVLAIWTAPSGKVQPDSQLTSIYEDNNHFSHLSPAWLVDEADQTKLGGLLLPWIDPFMDRQQGRRFATTFNNTYTALSKSDDFVTIGSVMGEAYRDMFLLPNTKGRHTYLYIPEKTSGKQLPVIVFLHGWLGNMKAYMWTLSRFAEEHDFIVICPTFRNGLWKGEDAENTLKWLSNVIYNEPMCNPDQIIVIGLSNGGTGVTRWAKVLPETFTGLVFVSPVLKHTDDTDFISAVGTRPILIVHGGRDTRIPPSYVNTAVNKMRKNNIHVHSICYPEEDHVLILSSQKQFHTDLLKWMEQWDIN